MKFEISGRMQGRGRTFSFAAGRNIGALRPGGLGGDPHGAPTAKITRGNSNSIPPIIGDDRLSPAARGPISTLSRLSVSKKSQRSLWYFWM